MRNIRWGPRRWRTAAFVAGLVAASAWGAAPANAAPFDATPVGVGGGAIYPGVNGLPPALPVATNLNGTTPGTLVDSMISIFSGTGGVWTVNLHSAVFRNADDTLSFYYQVTKLTGVEDPHRFTAINYTGFTTEAGFRTDAFHPFFLGGGDQDAGGDPNHPTDPGFMGGDGDSNPVIGPLQDFTWMDHASASTVGWDYDVPHGNELNTGETTVTMVIHTNATHYTAGTFFGINGGIGSGPTFAPANVPEPASMLLAGAGLAPLAGLLKRRRRSSETEETEEVA